MSKDNEENMRRKSHILNLNTQDQIFYYKTVNKNKSKKQILAIIFNLTTVYFTMVQLVGNIIFLIIKNKKLSFDSQETAKYSVKVSNQEF